MKRFGSLRRLFLLMITVLLTLACSLPGSTNSASNGGLESTRQALSMQQTQMALGFQQTSLGVGLTKAAQVPPTQPPTQAPLAPPTSTPPPPQPTQQSTYTPYPTYTTAPTTGPALVQASATPQPGPDIEARIRGSNILIYEDIKGYPRLLPWVNRAVGGMDFSGGKIVEVGDALGDFMTQLNSPTPWDLIIVAAELRQAVRGEFWDIILDQVNKKVGLVAEIWYLDSIINGRILPLMSKCGVTFQKDWLRDPYKYNVLDYSIYWLDQDNDLFKYPNMVSPLYTPNIYWTGDVGDRLKLGTGGDAKLVAGLFPKEKSSYGVLATCLEGRMVVQTFGTHDYRESQVIPLWQNYIYYTLKNHYKALAK